MSVEFDVVIVGGGAAGVGAARKLVHAGLSTLLVEAGTRLGGRAWTREIAGLELDMGAGWMHSAERNAWVRIAKAAGLTLDERRAAWGTQYRDLGFAPGEQAEAKQAMSDWAKRLKSGMASDRAADALAAGCPWNDYIRAIVGFISGAPLEQLSAADYVAYDETSTDTNWRAPSGFGALIARSFPRGVALSLATPVESLALAARGVNLTTRTGSIRARAVILTVSTAVLAGDTIELPRELDAWREAARCLPLGRDEKLFLEIVGDAPFVAETQVIGNPRNSCTGAYYLRPFDWPVVECFLGAEGARIVEDAGPGEAFAFAIDQLSALFGNDVRPKLRPFAASSWGRSIRVAGAYSYALPGHVAARARLAQPFDERIFFAGEATSATDFSTCHGAHDSGSRAAGEVIEALARRRTGDVLSPAGRRIP